MWNECWVECLVGIYWFVFDRMIWTMMRSCELLKVTKLLDVTFHCHFKLNINILRVSSENVFTCREWVSQLVRVLVHVLQHCFHCWQCVMLLMLHCCQQLLQCCSNWDSVAATVAVLWETVADVAVLSAIVKINSAAELDNSVWMYDCLEDDDAHLINLDAACREKYHRRLFKAKAAKSRVRSTLLLRTSLSNIIFEINLWQFSTHPGWSNCKRPTASCLPTICSGQVSLLPSAGW